MKNGTELEIPEASISVRKRIAHLEYTINQMEGCLGADPFPLTHTFTPGLYARQITVPAGVLIVTKLHRTEHLIFMLKGKVSILSEQGGIERQLSAPCMFISPAGVKRVVYTHEETVWINVHANPADTTDLRELEGKIIAKNYSELGLVEPLIMNELEGGEV